MGIAYEEWEFIPRRLKENELEDPMLAFERFFDFDHLPGARELLWTWLKVTVTASYCSELDGKEKRELLIFYEQIEMLIEAAYVAVTKKTKDEAD